MSSDTDDPYGFNRLVALAPAHVQQSLSDWATVQARSVDPRDLAYCKITVILSTRLHYEFWCRGRLISTIRLGSIDS